MQRLPGSDGRARVATLRFQNQKCCDVSNSGGIALTTQSLACLYACSGHVQYKGRTSMLASMCSPFPRIALPEEPRSERGPQAVASKFVAAAQPAARQ